MWWKRNASSSGGRERSWLDELLVGQRCELGADGGLHALRGQVSTASRTKTWPMTAAGSMTARSSGSRRSSRAARSAWIVGGTDTRSIVADGAPAAVLEADEALVDEHREQLLDEERVALGGLDDARADLVVEPGLPEQVARRPRRVWSSESGSSSIRRAGGVADHSGWRSTSSRRVGQTSRRRAVGVATTCSTSSRNVGSAQWMSSKSDDERAARRELLEQLAGPPEELLTGNGSCESPIADATRGDHVRVVVERRELRVRLLGVSRSAIPAAWRTASASGQNVMPSP